jgi:hypothetical protein
VDRAQFHDRTFMPAPPFSHVPTGILRTVPSGT